MPDPIEEAERQVAAHIAAMVADGLTRGVAGDWEGAVETIAPLFHQYGPDEAYAWTRAMIRTLPNEHLDCGCPSIPTVAQYNPITGEVWQRNIDDPDVPQGVAALARMIAAAENGDDDTVRALWDAVIANEDTQALVDIMQRVLRYAITAARQRMVEQQ